MQKSFTRKQKIIHNCTVERQSSLMGNRILIWDSSGLHQKKDTTSYWFCFFCVLESYVMNIFGVWDLEYEIYLKSLLPWDNRYFNFALKLTEAVRNVNIGKEETPHTHFLSLTNAYLLQTESCIAWSAGVMHGRWDLGIWWVGGTSRGWKKTPQDPRRHTVYS